MHLLTGTLLALMSTYVSIKIELELENLSWAVTETCPVCSAASKHLSLVDDISEPDTKQGSDTVSGNCRILLHVINNRRSVHSQEAEAGAVFVVTVQDRNMDLSILPNNNHPDKFLQLEGKSLLKSSAFLQASLAKFPEAALPGVQRWHNRVYLQVRPKRG